MPQWGMKDSSQDAVKYVTSSFNLHQDQATVDALYANGSIEAVSADNITTKRSAHTGWVVTKTGTGGRAGRVQREVLIAGGMDIMPVGYGYVTVDDGMGGYSKVTTDIDGVTYFMIGLLS